MTTRMQKVTVICELRAQPAYLALLERVGARGHTEWTVTGAGAHGARWGDTDEDANVQIEVIVDAATSDRLVALVQDEFFPCYPSIVYTTEVGVVRAGKFGTGA